MAGIRPGECDWPPATVARLRRFWGLKAADGTDGLSADAIGLLMGISKAAVTSKAHRLDLPARGTPRPRGRPRLHPPPVEPLRPPTRARLPLPAGACTLPPLPSELEDA